MNRKNIPIILLTITWLGTAVLAVQYRDAYNGLNSKPKQVTPAPSQSVDIYKLWQLTNQDREKAGLQPLKLNEKLSRVSEARCADMVKQNYYAHVNPQGLTPQNFITNGGLKWNMSGENLAAGSYTAETVNTGWLNSPEHKENIMYPQYTDMGIAVCHSSNSAIFGAGTIILEDFIEQA